MAQERTVRVRGHGSAGAVADGALLTLAAEAVGSDPGAALGAAATAAAAMIDAAVAAGAERSAVRTTGAAVEPQWEHRGGEPQPAGYAATTTFRVPVHAVADAGAVLTAAVSAGGTAARVRDLTLVTGDPAQAVRTAREAAFADARAQAEQYAGLAGAELGGLLHLAEDGEPDGWSRHGGEHFAVRASVAVPVLPGAEDVTVSVVATWELRSG